VEKWRVEGGGWREREGGDRREEEKDGGQGGWC
jgi:hypothetical protein